MTSMAKTEYARRPPQLYGAGRVAGYLTLVAVIATAIASVVGFLSVIAITFPLSLFAFMWLSELPSWLWNGAILAAPVTLLLLPVTAMIGRQHPVILYFALPVVGLVGGILAMRSWSSIRESAPAFMTYAKTYLSFVPPSVSGPGGELPIVAGAIAGLVAGAFFSAAIYEMRR